jgi:mannose-1-phosphate guanylyltransferase/phosphomannomutase
MKAIVLAAGRGKRLKYITQKIPKPMLKVHGEVLLEHNLKWLKKYRIKDVYINLHYLPDAIRNHFKCGSNWEIKINYSYETEILGTAGAVSKIVKDFGQQKWDDDFLVVYGDNFYPFSYNLEKIIDLHFKTMGLATVGLYNKKSEIQKSGVAILNEDNLIIDFIEKPSFSNSSVESTNHKYGIPKKRLINTGIYVLNKKIMDYIPKGFSDFGRDIFPKLLKNKVPVYGYVFEESLTAVDTIRLYEEVVRPKAQIGN